MAKNTKTQTKPPVVSGASPKKKRPRDPWTDAFVQVTEYILKDYRDKVTIDSEVELFKKPMRIDAVIIKQEDGLVKDQSLLWLRSLRDNLTNDEAVKLVKIAQEKSDDDPIRSIVYFLLDANPHTEEEVMKMVKASPRTKEFLNAWAVESGAAQAWKEEGLKAAARNMIAQNKFTADEIAEYTGLDIADVVMLQSAMI